MTAKTRRMLQVLALSFGVGLVAVAVTTYATWPANTLGNYIHDRRNREANVRALTSRIEREADPLLRRFYQAMLAEETGDLEGAIRGFRALRDETRPGTLLHLRSALFLGQAYGQNHQFIEELATYQALMESHPGASRLSQATYYLRRGEKARARAVLDEALARDAEDGSLGPDRAFARYLRGTAEEAPRRTTSLAR